MIKLIIIYHFQIVSSYFSIGDLTNSKTEQMVKFLPLILEKLTGLIISPPILHGQLLNCTSVAFETLATIVGNLTVMLIFFKH